MPDFAGYIHLGRRIPAEAAAGQGWGRPGDWLQDAAAWFSARQFDELARDCQSLARRAGVKGRRAGRGESAVPGASDLYEVLQLDRRTDRILPNGWCLLPPRQVCEKGNACLTCDLFVTDRSHLDALTRQQNATAALIDQRRAEFVARFGEPMSDDHVWLEPRLREARALESLLAALIHAETVRGGGVPGRSDGTSTLISITRKPT